MSSSLLSLIHRHLILAPYPLLNTLTLTPNTHKNYSHTWQIYNAWCEHQPTDISLITGSNLTEYPKCCCNTVRPDLECDAYPPILHAPNNTPPQQPFCSKTHAVRTHQHHLYPRDTALPITYLQNAATHPTVHSDIYAQYATCHTLDTDTQAMHPKHLSPEREQKTQN